MLLAGHDYKPNRLGPIVAIFKQYPRPVSADGVMVEKKSGRLEKTSLI